MKTLLKKSPGFTAFSLLLPCLLLGLQAGCATNKPTAAALQRLQGSWEGVLVSHEGAEKITIMITGNSLHFQGLTTNKWNEARGQYEATFTLPAGTNPRQLLATITGSGQTNGIGDVVRAIFKIEDGTLTLAGFPDQEPPKTSKGFEEPSPFHYKLRKVQPQKKNAEAITASLAY